MRIGIYKVTDETRIVQGGGPPEKLVIGLQEKRGVRGNVGRSGEVHAMDPMKCRGRGGSRHRPVFRRVSVPRKLDGHVAEAGNLPALVSPEVSPVAEAGTPPIPMHACLWS